MLLLSVAGNLRPTLEYLRDKIGVEPVRLGWALGSNPMLFSVSLTGFLQKNVRFYNRDLRIPHRTLGTMIGAYPALLTLSIENNVMPKIELLVESMGLSMSRATKLIIDTPAVLGRSRYSLWSSCYRACILLLILHACILLLTLQSVVIILRACILLLIWHACILLLTLQSLVIILRVYPPPHMDCMYPPPNATVSGPHHRTASSRPYIYMHIYTYIHVCIYIYRSSYNSLIAVGFEQKEVVAMLQSNARLLVNACSQSAELMMEALESAPLNLSPEQARMLLRRYPLLLSVRAGAERVRYLSHYLQVQVDIYVCMYNPIFFSYCFNICSECFY